MTALERIVPLLQCPVCAGALTLDTRRLGCGLGHSFDLARQGYVNLLAGRGHPGTADTTAMVEARARFLAGGHYVAIADRVAAAATPDAAPEDTVVVDLAGGTGYYLAAVLDRLPDALGLCLDVSAPALRRAARVHPRAAAAGADVWQRLPLRGGVAQRVLSVFGPRGADEVDRILAADGRVVVVAPAAEHLEQLREPLGMIGIDPRKAERQAATFGRFRVVGNDRLSYRTRLARPDIAAVVAMGPTASHIGPDLLARRIGVLPESVDVTVSVDVTTYAR